MTRRALLFNPGLHVLGGGERYTFALAQVIAETHEVVVAGTELPDRDVMRQLGFDDDVPLEVLPFDTVGRASAGYDLFVDVVTKPPPRPESARSFLVVQFPFEPLPSLRRRPRAWLRTRGRWPYTCLVYSQFVQTWVSRRWGQPSQVLAPPAQLGRYDAAAKEPLILAVGRLHPVNHHKRHDALFDAYEALPAAVRSRWRLVVAGAAVLDDEGRATVANLEVRAAACGAELRVNVDQRSLVDLYRRASLFWHAAGLGRPADRPELAEHFGIVTVEAMSHGVVPLVHADGGQPEIVVEGAGVLWSDIDELVDRSAWLTSDDSARREMAERAVEVAGQYAFDRFAARARDLLDLTSPQ